MRQVCGRIIAEETTASIEPNIATLDEAFQLLRYDELARADAPISPLTLTDGK